VPSEAQGLNAAQTAQTEAEGIGQQVVRQKAFSNRFVEKVKAIEVEKPF